jgi:hypothetical protein
MKFLYLFMDKHFLSKRIFFDAPNDVVTIPALSLLVAEESKLTLSEDSHLALQSLLLNEMVRQT